MCPVYSLCVCGGGIYYLQNAETVQLDEQTEVEMHKNRDWMISGDPSALSEMGLPALA